MQWTVQAWGLRGDLLEAGRHSHLHVECFLPQPLHFGESPPFLWDDGSSGFQSNLPPLRFSKVEGSLPKDYQPSLPAILFLNGNTWFQKIICLSHLGNPWEDCLEISIASLILALFPAWMFSSLRPFFLVKSGLVFFFTIRNF